LDSSEALGHHISGFVDGEGNFTIAVFKQRESRLGYGVHVMFVVGQAEREILELTRQILGCGRVHLRHQYNKDGFKRMPQFELRIQSHKDCLLKLIPFFDKYELLTKKKNDYLLWKTTVQMVARGEHLTRKGLLKIIEIKKKMEQGRSKKGRKSVPIDFIGRHNQLPILENWFKE